MIHTLVVGQVEVDWRVASKVWEGTGQEFLRECTQRWKDELMNKGILV